MMSSSNAQSSSKITSLPLEWTKISRRKRRKTGNNSKDQEKGLDCCEDDTCFNNEKWRQLKEEETNVNESNSASLSGNENIVTPMITMRGKGLFCLHELDCKWFQGHFLSSSIGTRTATGNVGNSIGLLVTQREDVDDCLQCANAGYRELDMKLLRPSSSSSLGLNGKRKELKIQKLVCTGGDMLRIHTPPLLEVGGTEAKRLSHATQRGSQPEEVKFEAEKIITGANVEPLVRRYFSNLVARMTTSSKKSMSVLDILPDCAVVVGDMSVTVPSQFICGMKRNLDENDGWMSD